MATRSTQTYNVPSKNVVALEPKALLGGIHDTVSRMLALADKRLADDRLTWKEGTETTGTFSFKFVIETSISAEIRAQKGRVTWDEDAQQVTSREALHDGAAKTIASFCNEELHQACISGEAFKEEAVVAFFARPSGELNLRADRVGAYTHCDCHGCSGKGFLRCEPCQGAGMRTCGECGGGRELKCNFCYGAGKRWEGNEYVWCTWCDRGWVGCRYCNAKGKLTCSHCRGTKVEDCTTCARTGTLTYSYVISEKTTYSALEPEVSDNFSQFKTIIASWASRGFPGAASGKAVPGAPFLSHAVTYPTFPSQGKLRCEVIFSGTFPAAVAIGELDQIKPVGIAISLDQKHYRFTPFLDPIVSKAMYEILLPRADLKTLLRESSNHPVLCEIARKVVKARNHERSGFHEELIEELCGALTERSQVGTIELAYSYAKRDWAKVVWEKAKKTFALQMVPIAAVFVLLNVPHHLTWLVSPITEHLTRYGSAALLALPLFLLPGLTIPKQITRGLEEGLGYGARLPKQFSAITFIAASALLLAFMVAGTSSSYITGPNHDGVFLTKSWPFQVSPS